MLSKMTALQIHIAGFCAALIVVLLLFLLVIKPKQATLQQTRQDVNDLTTNQHGTQTDVTQHQNDLTKAKKDKVQTIAQWQQSSSEYMPNIPFGTDVLQTYQDVVVNLPKEWGTFITAWYDAQRNKGVSRVPGVEFAVPSFSTDPNAVASLDHITFPPNGGWNVAVEATSFDALMAHLRRFNGELKHHGMPVVNNVSLEGQSPHLIGRYELALYVISPTKPPAADSRIGGAGVGAGGGIGAAGMGMGGGMMGMHGMRMGGPMGGPPGMMGGPMGGPGGPMMRPGMGGAPPAAPAGAPGVAPDDTGGMSGLGKHGKDLGGD
jgi:hypothetical protein